MAVTRSVGTRTACLLADLCLKPVKFLISGIVVFVQTGV
jgi:hypothetical protein